MAQYDPNKPYTWNPDDKFEFSGREFGLILNMVRAILSTEEAAKIMLAQQANSALEGALARAVETGTVKEMVKEPENVKEEAPE